MAPCIETRPSYVINNQQKTLINISDHLNTQKESTPDEIPEINKNTQPKVIAKLKEDPVTEVIPKLISSDTPNITRVNEDSYSLWDSANDSPPWLVTIGAVIFLITILACTRRLRKRHGYKLGGKGKRVTDQFGHILKAVETRSKEALKKTIPEDVIETFFPDTTRNEGTQTPRTRRVKRQAPPPPTPQNFTDDSISHIDVTTSSPHNFRFSTKATVHTETHNAPINNISSPYNDSADDTHTEPSYQNGASHYASSYHHDLHSQDDNLRQPTFYHNSPMIDDDDVEKVETAPHYTSAVHIDVTADTIVKQSTFKGRHTQSALFDSGLTGTHMSTPKNTTIDSTDESQESITLAYSVIDEENVTERTKRRKIRFADENDEYDTQDNDMKTTEL